MEQQKLLGDATPAPEIRPAAPLRVITEEGELADTCPTCLDMADQLDGAQKEIRSWRASYANLKRDREGEAKGDELWPEAVKLFGYWKERTKHKRSEWSVDRFWLCVPYLRDDGMELCRRAVEGIAYDPNTKVMRNGALERFDSWELLFRNRATFERYVNRAPYHLPDPEKVKTLADALAFLHPNMPLPECTAEAQRRLR